jgi:hypothetical protein
VIELARPDGETSNSLFEVLAEWNAYLWHFMPFGGQLSALSPAAKGKYAEESFGLL